MTDRAKQTRGIWLVIGILGLLTAVLGVVHGLFEHNDALIALYAVLGVLWVSLLTLWRMGRWPKTDQTEIRQPR